MENKTNTELRDLVSPSDLDNNLLMDSGVNAKSGLGRGVARGVSRVARMTPWTDYGEDIPEDGDLLD